MQTRGLAPNVITYNAVISACEKGRECQEALELFKDMQTRGLTPNVITYNAVISACEKGRECQEALRLFNEMQTRGHAPNIITYSAIIEVLSVTNEITLMHNIVKVAILSGIWNDVKVKRNSIDALDLHNCSVAVSKALIRHYILEFNSVYDAKSSTLREMLLITGRGNHVLDDGRKGVLREEIEIFVK